MLYSCFIVATAFWQLVNKRIYYVTLCFMKNRNKKPKSKVNKTHSVHEYNPYILGLQRQMVESVAPDTKLPSLGITGARTLTSESLTLTQHRSL